MTQVTTSTAPVEPMLSEKSFERAIAAMDEHRFYAMKLLNDMHKIQLSDRPWANSGSHVMETLEQTVRKLYIATTEAQALAFGRWLDGVASRCREDTDSKFPHPEKSRAPADKSRRKANTAPARRRKAA